MKKKTYIVLKVLLTVLMVVNSGLSFADTAIEKLSPENAFTKFPLTEAGKERASSLFSDMRFFGLILYLHRSVISEGKDIGGVFEDIKKLPYWGSSDIRTLLTRNFLKVSGDVLTVEFSSGSIVRVLPAGTHIINGNGSIEDCMVPDFHTSTGEHFIQYFAQSSLKEDLSGTSLPVGIPDVYLKLWEKARPYYDRARPGDTYHVLWMMREAYRIAAAEKLDPGILLPVVILHDVGYAACLADEKARTFDKDVKLKHMAEGAKIAREILLETGYPLETAEKVARLVGVHDNWRIGDNSPFRESREMGVFQDLDFTWMATEQGFETARAHIMHKTPREMLDFIEGDEKHTDRPFATTESKRLYESLIAERKRQIEMNEEGPSSDGDEYGQAMVGFGPMVSYEALRIVPDLTGIYITVEREEKAGEIIRKFVCRTEEGVDKRARDFAEMLGQVLEVMDIELNPLRAASETELMRNAIRILDEMKIRLEGRKIDIEVAYNLKANSARYSSKIVFNNAFLTILYEMWHAHRVEHTPAKWSEEVGALQVLIERLFHELDHDHDEIVQITRDRLLYKAMFLVHGFVQNAVKFDADMPVGVDVGGHTMTFGEAFRTNEYFAMIHRISELSDHKDIDTEIKRYLEDTFRYNSSKRSIGLPDHKLAFAGKMLKDHGINDDPFGESIMGEDFRKFFQDHCLFTNVPPYDYYYTEKERKLWVQSLYRRNVPYIKDRLLSVGRGIGKEDETARWIKNSLARTDIKGAGSTKRKLYPIIQWASRVVHPQNYELREGRLFGSIYYHGLNLMTVPIFPLDAQGEIDWDLMEWAYEGPRSGLRSRAPPKTYFDAKKISLYEYLITHSIPEPQVESTRGTTSFGDTPERSQPSLFEQDPILPFAVPGYPEPGEPEVTDKPQARDTAPVKGKPEQLMLFDITPYEVNSKSNVELTRGTTFEEVSRDIEMIHLATMSVDITPTLDIVTHVILDSSVLGDGQGEIKRFLNKRARDPLVAEKVVVLDGQAIERYMAENGCDRDNTVVILPDDLLAERLGGEAGLLIASKDGITDIVNVEGLLGAARCVLNKDWDSFRDIFELLTGEECPEISPEWLDDPVLFARKLVVKLPHMNIIDVSEQLRINQMLKEMLVAA